ncbi:MAG: hypothetical protein E7289_08735 [Lachnospiraceae bacterium]|nr:hypothetical protein [Lachnospiraceae bacterium]
MDFLNKLGTKAGETFQTIKESDATKKAKNYAGIPGLSLQVGKQEGVIKKAYEEIGKAYYKANKNNPNCEYADQMAAIKEAKAKIAELKAEIEAKKSYDPSEDDVVEVIKPEETTVVVDPLAEVTTAE